MRSSLPAGDARRRPVLHQALRTEVNARSFKLLCAFCISLLTFCCPCPTSDFALAKPAPRPLTSVSHRAQLRVKYDTAPRSGGGLNSTSVRSCVFYGNMTLSDLHRIWQRGKKLQDVLRTKPFYWHKNVNAAQVQEQVTAIHDHSFLVKQTGS